MSRHIAIDAQCPACCNGRIMYPCVGCGSPDSHYIPEHELFACAGCYAEAAASMEASEEMEAA